MSESLPVRLFRGDVPLVWTYWIWGVLIGGVLLSGIATLIDVTYLDIIGLPYAAVAMNTFYVLATAYSVFLWCAIWRSAGKYQGKYWGSIARAVVVLSILVFAGQALQGFKTETSLAQQVETMNKHLPAMIEPGIRMDRVTLDGNVLTYDHTIVDMEIVDLNAYQFQATLKSSLTDRLCTDWEVVSILRSGTDLVYTYTDPHRNRITEVPIAAVDCINQAWIRQSLPDN